MKQFSILFFLALILPALSNAQTHFPLKEGARWTYNYNGVFDQTGESFFVVEILEGKEVLKDQSYYQVKTASFQAEGAEAAYTQVSYSRVDDKGNVFSYDSESSDELFFPADVVKDKSWSVGNSEFKVLELKGSIETPKGTYEDCVVLTRTENGQVISSYFKKDIGLVAIRMGELLMAYLTDYSL
jgi:hypothetical protein